ncbi:ATP synthase subunit I [Methylohalobius crimeensis]|uniref:ATP synthase subunit I n=1 Tax=Methylohalobius crimeensis TaxID=244365 RepID=UPI0003B2F211|nr:ATP synthase subunit I [Methylohalobius crimeensis]
MGVNVAAEIGRILYMQAAVLAVVFLGVLAGFGWQAAKSAALGGMIALIPNAYFALRISRSEGKSPRQVVRGFYLGEIVKLALTAALFFLVLRLPGIVFLPLFAGFVAVLGVFWFALLLNKKPK